MVWEKEPDRSEPRRNSTWIQCEPAVQLSHSPDLAQWHAKFVFELAGELNRYGGAACPVGESVGHVRAWMSRDDRGCRSRCGADTRDAMRIHEVPESGDDPWAAIPIRADDHDCLPEY